MSIAHPPVTWLEISADYLCNNRCYGCFSVQDSGDGMSTREAFDELFHGKRLGAKHLWLGGGDPTLRKDLTRIIHKAKLLGYERIKLETNGMLLAYPTFTRKCVQAGLTEVNFSVKGHTPELHDRLTTTPRCFELMMRGIAECRTYGLRLEADVLVYRSNYQHIPDIVRFFHEHGIQRFNLWMFSATDQQEQDFTAEVPRISEVMPFIQRALDLGLSDDPDFISSLHTPPCTIPASHRQCSFHAAQLELLVANPGGFRFMLETSPIEGGHFLPRCDDCALRQRCSGPRADYIAVHGDHEFQPVP